MIHAYLPIKTHINDPAIPIYRALYRWPIHICQPAPYLSMIHAYQPTKIHIYDASIPANQAPYLWSMHTSPPSPYLWSMHTNQPSSISMVHSYQQTSSISIYDPCISTNQAPYLWFMHTNQLWKHSSPWLENKSAASSVFAIKQRPVPSPTPLSSRSN